MNSLTYLVMIGWIPVVLYLFSRVPVQRAVILSFLIAWLFLPMAAIPLAGLPDYTKMSATCYGILLATLIFDSQRFFAFRLHWIDSAMLIWCLCPVISSLTNDLGLYDGLSVALAQTVTWGFPYFLGRLYLSSLQGLQELAVGIVWGGLIYVPLCLLEIRLSPQLHRWLYGFSPQSFDQAIRYGGYRPIVFMQHGLMVGTWMMTATLIGFVLWRVGVLQQLLQRFAQGTLDPSSRTPQNRPLQPLYRETPWGTACIYVLTLLVTFVLLKSTGAYVQLLMGIVLLLGVRWLKSALPLLLVMLAMCGYLTFAAAGGMTLQTVHQISTTITQFVNADRAQSLVFRLQNEAALSAKARLQPWFGWGGWGRSRIYNAMGEDISVTDSLWIIYFGNYGFLGLMSWFGALLLPVVGFVLLTYRVEVWWHPQILPAATLAVGLTLYTLDCLINGMVNPIYTLVAGGLAGIVAHRSQVRSVPATLRHGNVKSSIMVPGQSDS
ncbi:MAG: O-antigen ligase domain-containing protein [Thermosynechococcaceae cyanobacterium]